MSQEVPVLDLSCTANSDLSGGINPDSGTNVFPTGSSDPRYRFVKYTAARTVDASTLAADNIAGVLKNRPISGQLADIAVMGTSKVRAGAAISANTLVMHDNATGKVITATHPSNALAFALEAATADGDVIECIIFPATPVVV